MFLLTTQNIHKHIFKIDHYPEGAPLGCDASIFNYPPSRPSILRHNPLSLKQRTALDEKKEDRSAGAHPVCVFVLCLCNASCEAVLSATRGPCVWFWFRAVLAGFRFSQLLKVRAGTNNGGISHARSVWIASERSPPPGLRALSFTQNTEISKRSETMSISQGVVPLHVAY